MQVISKQRAIELLNRCIKEGSALPLRGDSSNDYGLWRTWLYTLNYRASSVYPADAIPVRTIKAYIQQIEEERYIQNRAPSLVQLLAMLKGYVTEIEELWSDDQMNSAEEQNVVDQDNSSVPHQASMKVFIVHGHDHGTMQTIARFIERLGLEAIILHEQASAGNTIIEKLEEHGKVGYCVVLLTPDDIGGVASNGNNLKPRARQNVVLELGYFMGRLGRRGTCALVAGGVEIPSDYSGVVYIPLDKDETWKIHLTKELRAAGLPADANNIV